LSGLCVELRWATVDAVISLKIKEVAIGTFWPLDALVSVGLGVKDISIDASKTGVTIFAG